MTTTATAPARPTQPSPPNGNPWRPTWGGVGLVARIEILRRRPTRKGYIFYGLLLGFIAVLSVLATVAAEDGKTSTPLELILVMVMGTGYLIGPSLSATAINGDSSDGVLAPMQMTRLTAGDLAFGKLLATWAVSVVALVSTAPFLWYAAVRSGWTGLELLTVLGVILFLVLVGTAMGLAWSSIAARNAVSVALTHVTSGVLGLGTLIVFAFSAPLVNEDVTVTDRYPDWSQATTEQQNDPDFDSTTLPCTEHSYTQVWSHTDRTAWMLLVNPLFIVGESSPVIDPNTWREDGRASPGFFAFVHTSLSDSRVPTDPPTGADYCTYPDWGHADGDQWQKRQDAMAVYPRQPWVGLGAYALLGVASMVITVRRLRVPYKKLGVGTRVA
jgi:ABC-type transport system involved in multi-copper enzyme maturation permease subunit